MVTVGIVSTYAKERATKRKIEPSIDRFVAGKWLENRRAALEQVQTNLETSGFFCAATGDEKNPFGSVPFRGTVDVAVGVKFRNLQAANP